MIFSRHVSLSRAVLVCGALLTFVGCATVEHNSGVGIESIASKNTNTVTINQLNRDIAQEGGIEFWCNQIAEKIGRGVECSTRDIPKGCLSRLSFDLLVNVDPALVGRMGFEQSPIYADAFSTAQDKADVTTTALEDLMRLAHAQYPPACLMLAIYHDLKGMDEKTLYWTFMAADVGCPEAMGWLCERYAQGRGVIQDMPEAVKWRILAGARGDINARATISSSQSILRDVPEFVEGQRRAVDWQQKHLSAFMSP